MKKIIALLLVVVMAFSMVGCRIVIDGEEGTACELIQARAECCQIIGHSSREQEIGLGIQQKQHHIDGGENHQGEQRASSAGILPGQLLPGCFVGVVGIAK